MTSVRLTRYRQRALLTAGSIGLLLGASIGAVCLGNHLAQQNSLRINDTRLVMASAEGQIDTTALNIATRFSRYASEDNDNVQMAQNLNAIRTSEDARSQANLVVRSSEMTAVSPLSSVPMTRPAVRAAAAMNFKAANNSDTDCLTQAVYYEARGEGASGMQAVAQVILNRVRHPAYPKSICGVVYQGANLRTSCQFSFVCNGAMGARVEPSAWRRAKSVAEAALNGYVMADIGTSTSFHTTGVSPRWSGTMSRVTQVGTHVFYQFRGRRALIANSADNIRPSVMPHKPDASDIRPTPTLIASHTPADTQAATQVSAKLTGQTSELINALTQAGTTNPTKPVQVTAHVRGKSAQEIVAEVALPGKKTPEAAPAPVAAKGISQ